MKLFVLMLPVLLASCVSQYKITASVSAEVRDYYTAYPSIEVDIAAVTDDEVSELKNMKVEDYFAPNSSIRVRLEPKTFYFTEEYRNVITLDSRDKIWQKWLQKKPKVIVVIVSLPPDLSAGEGTQDPRLFFLPMKKGFIAARRLRVEIEPKKITLLDD
jgi:hypothetical protein